MTNTDLSFGIDGGEEEVSLLLVLILSSFTYGWAILELTPLQLRHLFTISLWFFVFLAAILHSLLLLFPPQPH